MSLPNKKSSFVIPTIKSMQSRDPDMAQKSWEKLENAIQEIYKENAGTLSFEELYRTGYNMVLHKHGEFLYSQVQRTLTKRSEFLLDQAAQNIDETFLPAVKKIWEDYKRGLQMVRDILMYMDRSYVKQNNKKPVYDVGVETFGVTFLRSPRMKDRLRQLLLGLVKAERTGEKIDRNLLRSMTFILFEIGKDIYAEDFEKPFKEEMQLFYAYESQAFLEANSCPDYLKKVEARLREEYDRVHSCLPSDYAGGEGSIKQVAEHELIGKHKETLVDKDGSGLTRLLEDDKVDDLKRMYDLFSRVRGGGELLEDRVALFCLEKGKEIVLSTDNQADPLLYVRKLLELKERMDHFVKEAFKGERAFTNKTHRSFSEILNLYARSPEYISLAMDNYLRGGKGSSSAGSRGGSASSSKVGGTLGEVVTEEQVEAVLEKCLQLFRFLSEKDMFERYYKQHLAKRLLYDRSQSEEMERKVIQMLKTECGYQFTAKLEGMFKDVGTSKDVQERFGQLQQLHERRESGQIVDLQIKVLTTGYWPTTASSQVYRLPAEVEAVRGSFERFYLNQHNGRKLTWQLAQGSADVKAKYDKVYQINMPTQHMVVLMLFNEGGAGAAGGGEGATLTLAEIEKATGLSQSELKRVMQSLALSNFKLLSKEPKTKEVEATDKFTVNKGFTNRMIKFKMSVVAATKETNEEHQASRAKIQEDRGPQIDAAIVRVMKSRKTMNHNDLMVEVTKQLQSRFTPHPGDIKKRIEGLIGREFLTRSTSAMNVYEYVA